MTSPHAHDLATRGPRRTASVRRVLALPAAAGVLLVSSVLGSAALAAQDAAPGADLVPVVGGEVSDAQAPQQGAPASEQPGSPEQLVQSPEAVVTPAPDAQQDAVDEEGGPVAAESPTTSPAAPPSSAPTTAPPTIPVLDVRDVRAGTVTTPSGATYDTSSASVRPRLTLTGWTDAQGAPLTGTVPNLLEIALVDADGHAQQAFITPGSITAGEASYYLPLWPFTKNMDPHEGDYTIRYRVSGTESWADAGTVHLRVTLAAPGTDARLSLSEAGTDLVGTGWSFDGKTAINGVFKVALRLTDADGNTVDANVPATFVQGTFTITLKELASVAPEGGDVSVQALRGTEPVGEPVTWERPLTDPPSDPGPAPAETPTTAPSEPVVPAPAPLRPAWLAGPEAIGSPGADQPVPSIGDDTVTRDITVLPGEDAAAGQAVPVPVPLSEALTRPVEGLPPSAPLGGATGPVEAAEGVRASRPATRPQSPVVDASELTAANAGSLSGDREGDTVRLYLPRTKARPGDWVSVFLLPGGTTTGWTRVDASNAVSVEVSTLGAGTYQVVVSDRDNGLLGWAQLEISETVATTDPDAGAIAVPRPSGGDLLGPSDWMLVSAGGLLMLGAASFIVLARPARVPSRH